MKRWLLFFFVVVIYSCSIEDRFDKEQYTIAFRRDCLRENSIIDDVKEYAVSLPGVFSTDNTKSLSRSIKTIIRFTDTKYYKGIDSSLVAKANCLYLVDYDNDCGSAIIYMDSCFKHTIAFIESGSIIGVQPDTKNGIYSNDGNNTIYDILELLPYYLAELDMYLIPQPVCNDIDSTDANGYYYCAPRFYYSQEVNVGSLRIPTPNMHQFNPYNSACCFYNGYEYIGPFPAGCNAIAAAIIMAYYQYPGSYSYCGLNRLIDWTESDSSQSIAQMIAVLGELFYTTYSYNNSQGYPQYAGDAFDYFGYLHSNQCPLSYNVVKNDIDAGRPIFTYGFPNNNATGHTWVIDGYKETIQYYMCEWSVYGPDGTYRGKWSNIVPGVQQAHNYVYCNWGQGGSGNGYYSMGMLTMGGVNYSTNATVLPGIRVDNS